MKPWAVHDCVFPEAKKYPVCFGIIHVDMNAEKNEYSQSDTLMQNIKTELSETDFLRCHLMITSLMMNVQAINDSAPPNLGMIAMDFWRDNGYPPPMIGAALLDRLPTKLRGAPTIHCLLAVF